jgi:hypothetical protein
MLRVLLPVLTIVLLLMAAPAAAIPICPSASMAEYVGFASQGCQFNGFRFSNFEYSHPEGVILGIFGPRIFPSLSAISVQPRTSPTTLGSAGVALRFSPPKTPFLGFGGVYWDTVNIGFNVFAAEPWLVGNTVSAGLQSIADLEPAFLSETTVPGGSLFLFQRFNCLGTPSSPPECGTSRGISFPAVQFQTVSIFGDNVRDIEAGFATPEPATLLLVGTGAAGLGAVRWWKRRRAHE